MFIGHYAAALAAAALPRAPRLGPLFVAAQLPAVAMFLLALAGVEHYAVAPFHTVTSALFLYDVPWSHSLLGTLGLAALWAVGWRLANGGKDAAWLGAAVVAAHWPLDWLVHPPELTLAGGGAGHGLGLYDHPYLAMPLELGLVFVALAFYAERVPARGWRGRTTLALLVLATVAMQLADWLGPRAYVAADPAPPALAWRALASYTILAVLAWWTGAARGAPAGGQR